MIAPTVADQTEAIDKAEVTARWRQYATSGRTLARIDRDHGDQFGASIREVRAAVRTAAAELLAHTEGVAAAAQRMHRSAIECHLHGEPAWDANYDRRMLDYVRSRTWQACASELDPTLPEVQRRLWQ